MIKLIAFDWNGTMISDARAAIASDNIALKAMGYKEVITVKRFQQCFDIPIINYWQSLGMPKSFFKKTHG